MMQTNGKWIEAREAWGTILLSDTAIRLRRRWRSSAVCWKVLSKCDSVDRKKDRLHSDVLTGQQIPLIEAAFRRQGGGFMAVYDYGHFGTCKEKAWIVQLRWRDSGYEKELRVYVARRVAQFTNFNSNTTEKMKEVLIQFTVVKLLPTGSVVDNGKYCRLAELLWEEKVTTNVVTFRRFGMNSKM